MHKYKLFVHQVQESWLPSWLAIHLFHCQVFIYLFVFSLLCDVSFCNLFGPILISHFVLYFVNAQSFMVTNWNVYGRPALDIAVQKVF